MNRFSGSTFNHVTVRLDNNQYTNCTFQSCTIEYAGEGPIGLAHCKFYECDWVMVGYARHTLEFLASIYSGMGDFGKEMVEATFENIKKSHQNRNENKRPN